MDDTTEAGRRNNDMLDQLDHSAMDQANAIYNTSRSYDALRGSLTAFRDQLVAAAMDMDATEDQARALADSVLQIPDQTELSVAMPTFEQTSGQITGVM